MLLGGLWVSGNSGREGGRLAVFLQEPRSFSCSAVDVVLSCGTMGCEREGWLNSFAIYFRYVICEFD